MNNIQELQRVGQSVWLDYIRRDLIRSGELKRLVGKGLLGMTSNPTIFSKALLETQDYDEQLKKLCLASKSAEEVYIAFSRQDIQEAADCFEPVYEATKGQDGYVSWEANPHLAYDTDKTIHEVGKLFELAERHNVMIKIPATKQGLPAIRESIANGINVNVTLIFSIKRYEEVTEAYFTGLEERLRKGKPIDHIHSVASVFVSRIDTKTDAYLKAKGMKELVGKVAIANVKLLYAKFKGIFHGNHFKSLAQKGANIQRPLWGSTSTKNPAYRDVVYVEELIGPHTVNTMPQATLQAFLDHGKIDLTLEKDIEEAKGMLSELKAGGIDFTRITQELEQEGVKIFQDSFDQMMYSLGKKEWHFKNGSL